MEPGQSVKTGIITILSICLIAVLSLYTFIDTSKESYYMEKAEASVEPIVEQIEEVKDPIVYDGMTLNELSEKLERSLNSDLKGKGYLYASYSLELGLDPYLAVAISLHETGCTWECSYLTKYCNNVGGQKGNPGCNGEYKYYASLDEGIKGYMDNLYYNYYAKGLMTPEQINVYYAEDKGWANNINAYIQKIKAN